MVDQHKFKLNKQWFIESHVGNIKDVYHFVERLGAGGFGVVYLAEDRATGKSYNLISKPKIHNLSVLIKIKVIDMLLKHCKRARSRITIPFKTRLEHSKHL
jgi:serine/threonine protein kinase